jgi:hypothetical protein
MIVKQKNSLTENVINTSNELNNLLVNEGAALFVDLEKNVSCKNKIDELTRLIKTLEQYSTKSRSLEYIGFLGHFSSGKSSTTNSLLKTWNTAGQRATDLHPTDDSITLTTHKDNSHKLLGTHRKGDLKVGSQFVNVESLKDRVLVDTPGSGDPGIIEEMVRDFLPICDHIIYVFSATTPLDSNDIPILKKSYDELPFIPLKFIVTRANEFIKDRTSIFSGTNIDSNKVDKFTSELIARLQHILPNKRFVEDDFLFIDNLDKYNIDKLEEYIFNPLEQVKDLHSHKIQYFIDNIKGIRNYFKVYTHDQIQSLDKLVQIASSNHNKYKQSFLMGKSDLTENWRNIYDEICKKNISLEKKVNQLRKDTQIPSNIEHIPCIKDYKSSVRDGTDMDLDSYAESIVNSIEEMFESIIYAIKTEAKEIINNSSIEDIEIFSLIDIETPKHKFRNSAMPQYLLSKIESLQDGVVSNLDKYKLSIDSTKNYILSVTKNNLNSNINSEEKYTIKSQKELEKILDNFYNHVTIYKGAILAIDAIAIAEKLRLGGAIDELNNVELKEEYKKVIKEEVIGSIYSDRMVHIETYQSELSSVRDKTTKIMMPDTRSTDNDEGDSVDLTKNMKNAIDDHINDGELKKTIKKQIISEIQSNVINTQKECRDNIIEEKKKIRYRMFIRLAGATLIGFVLGLFVILNDNNLISKIPFLKTFVTNSLGSSFLTELFFVLSTTGLAWIFNNDKKEHDKNMTDIPEIKKSELIKHVEQIKLNKGVISDLQKTKTEEFLSSLWRATTDQELKRSISYNQSYFNSLHNYSISTLENLEIYQKSSTSFLTRTMDIYNDPKSNLDTLTYISHKIKDDAIEPSFNLFKSRQSELNDFYEKIRTFELV